MHQACHISLIQVKLNVTKPVTVPNLWQCVILAEWAGRVTLSRCVFMTWSYSNSCRLMSKKYDSTCRHSLLVCVCVHNHRGLRSTVKKDDAHGKAKLAVSVQHSKGS